MWGSSKSQPVLELKALKSKSPLAPNHVIRILPVLLCSGTFVVTWKPQAPMFGTRGGSLPRIWDGAPGAT